MQISCRQRSWRYLGDCRRDSASQPADVSHAVLRRHDLGRLLDTVLHLVDHFAASTVGMGYGLVT